MDAIVVRDISKKFKNYQDKKSTLKEKVLSFGKTRNAEEYWALKNISLNIKKGETVGLIGRNGSGKSTLLKVLTKILYPTSGEIIVKGRVSSLLELGAGFHPDFTGIENIYMNASILGLSRKEIDEKIESIILFSELGEFIYKPVRVYSSGMYMRLAFSVAISVNPDVLLIDEILAVGDAAFQNKCLNKIKELKGQGTTIVIVTHDNGVVEKLCDEAVWLHQGVIREQGDPRDVIVKYLTELSDIENQRLLKEDQSNHDIKAVTDAENEVQKVIAESNKNVWGNKKVELKKVTLLDENGKERKSFITGDPMHISLEYEVNQSFESIAFGIGIFTPDNICCYGTNTYIDKIKIKEISKRGTVICEIEKLSLVPGEYYLDVAIHDENGEPFDYQSRQYKFQVNSSISDTGISRQFHEWKIAVMKERNDGYPI